MGRADTPGAGVDVTEAAETRGRREVPLRSESQRPAPSAGQYGQNVNHRSSRFCAQRGHAKIGSSFVLQCKGQAQSRLGVGASCNVPTAL